MWLSSDFSFKLFNDYSLSEVILKLEFLNTNSKERENISLIPELRQKTKKKRNQKNLVLLRNYESNIFEKNSHAVYSPVHI